VGRLISQPAGNETMQDRGQTGKNSIEEVRRLHARVANLERLDRDMARHEGTDQELDRAWIEWERTFDATKDAIILIDSQFKIVQANLAASHFFGKPLDEIVGNTCWKLVHATEQPPENCPLKAAQSTKKHEEMELQIPEKDLWIEVSVDPIVNEQGQLTSAVHIIRDITERKRAEEELRRTQKEQESILTTMSEHVVYRDMEMRILWANRAASESVGLAPEQLVGRYCYEIWHQRRNPCSVCPAKEVIKSGKREEMEVTTPDGRIWFIRAYPVKNANGEIIGIANTTLEITERKRAEEELNRLSNAVRMSTDAIVIGDLEAKIIDVNEATLRMYGTDDKGDFVGKNSFDLIAPEDREKAFIGMEETLANGYTEGREYHIIIKDGSEIPVEMNTALMKDEDGIPIGFVGVSRDITERKRAEQALRESEKKYKDLFENAREAIVTVDLDGKITEVNKLIEEYGFKKKELIGKILFDFIPEYDKARSVSDFELLVGGVPVKGEMDVITTKGIFTVEYGDNPIVRRGKVVGVQIILTDITKRKRAEQLLRKERDKAQKYLDVAAVMMVAIDSEQRVGLINRKGCEILGYSEDEILGKNWFVNFLPKRIKDQVREIFKKVMVGENESQEYYENPILTKNGDERLIAWHNTILRDDKGQVIAALSSGEDITERKRAEQKLLDDQAKLKSLASELTLAEECGRHRVATALHDQISQALVISKMKLEQLRKSRLGEELVEGLDEVCKTLDTTIAATRSLTFDLSSPVLYELGFETAVAEWLTEQIQKRYSIRTEFEDDGQPKPLEDDIRVLLFRDVRELLINVVKHANARKVRVSISRANNQMCVVVEDDGVGFDPSEVASRTGPTAGFGLFSIRERLEELGGHLEIESTMGQGSKITMIAPLKMERIGNGDRG